MVRQTNGFDSDSSRSYLERLLNIEDERASEVATIRNRAKADREEVLDEAKEAGIPKKILKAKYREEMLKRKVVNVREQLLESEEDDALLFDQLTEALGDFGALPLGQAALARA